MVKIENISMNEVLLALFVNISCWYESEPIIMSHIQYPQLLLRKYDTFPNRLSIYLELLLFFRNETSLVNLKLQKKGKEVSNVVYGREYSLMADVTHPDGKQNAPFHCSKLIPC